MSVQGVKRIKIPVKPSDVSRETLDKYLKYVFEQFTEIREGIKKDYDLYRLDHPILNKSRIYKDSLINNKIIVPNLKSMVDWKVGYVLGIPINYAQNSYSDTNDIEYLNKYARDVSQRSIDEKVATWIYATGVGYYFIEPKTKDFDTESEAPYVEYAMESDSCAKVYSSYLGNEELFDIIYTTHRRIKDDVEYVYDILNVYFDDTMYTYEKDATGVDFVFVSEYDRGMKKPLPLVEKRADESGIGIVALGKGMQEAIDRILSNGLDNIEEVVNQIFVYKNVNLGDTPEEMAQNHSEMVQNGALSIDDPSPDVKADVYTIKPELSVEKFVEIYNVINKALHDAAGVPMEQSNSNSGGTTKSGSEVANGYENAYNRAINEQNILLEGDYKLLKKIIWICKNSQNNKINRISASDVEIKYNFNLTDSILIKSQAFGTLIQYMPADMALRICRLSNDPEKEGARIDEKMAEFLTQTQVKREKEKETNINE